ncbi:MULTISPECIES: hypothetical protein [unclassified Pedobacter]|uniref:hypothetical protein n=1 Tax=unclassified Pedobacter TaxID=2628915 RepID=UPI001DE44CE6|nr:MULTISPECIES: hypothetical protein [unclassified Pedobacter]CAH0265757.1 hypothetical protein SRABI36_03592 [Pedobacter sp. Bi36]CAH0292122.1 hypothetical protein SRABI126_04086 [Pedobacter sp. Bi126]
MITEKQLKELSWSDFSIMDLTEGKIALILLCDSTEKATQLRELFYDFDVVVYLNEETQKVSFKVTFNNSEFEVFYKTDKTVADYFPLSWLLDKKVNYLTTGYREPNGNIQYHLDLFKLAKGNHLGE